jgi:signal transduction histidine kinase
MIKYSPLPTLNIIPYQFEQLFTNLIANSLKFSKPTITPQIEISSRIIKGAESGQEFANPYSSYHQISIRDNGIGFDPEFSERIFQVFQRLHGRHEYTGTGIGLAIVKKIVENHQGLISALSKPGEGAAFSIYIPEGLN